MTGTRPLANVSGKKNGRVHICQNIATVGTFAYFLFMQLYHVFVGIGTEWLR